MATALVIDDSRAIRMILGKQLATFGYQVLQAGNGKDALTVLEKNPSVSLVLVDWNMPEMNGLEFLQRMRADSRYSGVIAVMVTTETEISQMEKALCAGANDYVMKPFTEEIIMEKLLLLGLVQEQIA